MAKKPKIVKDAQEKETAEAECRVQDLQIDKELTFKLTQEEMASKAELAAEVASDIGDLEAEFDSVKKSFKAKIEDKSLALEKIFNTIRSREEVRKVSCTMLKDFQTNIVQFLFDGNVMEERAMTSDEMQVEMDLKAEDTPDDNPFMDAAEESGDDDVRDVIRQETNKRTKKDVVTQIPRH